MSIFRDVVCCVGFLGCRGASLSSELHKCAQPILQTEAQGRPSRRHEERRAGGKYGDLPRRTCDLVFRGQEPRRSNGKNVHVQVDMSQRCSQEERAGLRRESARTQAQRRGREKSASRDVIRSHREPRGKPEPSLSTYTAQ